MNFIAHAGHDDHAPTDETTITSPDYIEQTETAQAVQTPTTHIGDNLPHDVWVGCALIIGTALLWLVMGRVLLKLKLAVKMLIITTGLLVVGVTTYQFAPVVSTVALAVGMALSLLGVLAQLAIPRRQMKE